VRVFLAVLAALLLGGCGGSSTTSSGAPSPTSKANSTPFDACSLLSQAQAAVIIGPDAASIGAASGGSTCAYASTSTGAVLVVGGGRIPNGNRVIQQTQFKLSGLQAVSGIGDIAGESKSASDVKIEFWKGQTFVILEVTNSGAGTAPLLESLAKTIAGHV
jgi:hypothetical protein